MSTESTVVQLIIGLDKLGEQVQNIAARPQYFIYIQDAEPQRPEERAIWFRPHPAHGTIVKVYVKGEWI